MSFKEDDEMVISKEFIEQRATAVAAENGVEVFNPPPVPEGTWAQADRSAHCIVHLNSLSTPFRHAPPRYFVPTPPIQS